MFERGCTAGPGKMSANGEATETDNDIEDKTSETTPAWTEIDQQEAREMQQQQQQAASSTADPMTVMQAALASFDGLRVDAAIQVYNVKNVKSFPNHKTHRAALISVSLALSQTPVYTARPRMLMHRAACLFTSQLSLVRVAPTHGGMARLS